jgi:hypothetical protein
MGNGKWWISALLAIAALLLMPRMGHALETASFSCSPAAGETVLPGDTVDYTLTIGQDGATDQWTALRIRLGEGMLIDQDSVTVLPFLQPEASSAPQADTTPAPSPAQTEEPQAEYEIVPGNDGFVVLCSSLQAGDEICFSARVDGAQADVSAYAQTEGFAVSVLHRLGALPQASAQPAENAAPVQADGQSDGAGAIRWTLAVLCFMALCGIAVIAYRKWGGSLKCIRIRLPWQKGKVMCVEAEAAPAAMAEAGNLPAEGSAKDAEPECERKNTHGNTTELQHPED